MASEYAFRLPTPNHNALKSMDEECPYTVVHSRRSLFAFELVTYR
jgi:hypothetical protein